VLLSTLAVKSQRGDVVRISELSRITKVPIPSIKYYLREGLLPPGETTAPNQAAYDERHVHRLRLIRVLVEVGHLGIATVREVLRAVDDPTTSLHDLLGIAHRELGPHTRDGAPLRDEVAEVDRFVEGLGWRVGRAAPGRLALAHALAALRQLGWGASTDGFFPYARAADKLAAREVKSVSRGSRAEIVERMVVGTVVFDAVLIALRRLAQEHHSAMRSG
jgi:DNA-binding transcriptional MerR regulator